MKKEMPVSQLMGKKKIMPYTPEKDKETPIPKTEDMEMSPEEAMMTEVEDSEEDPDAALASLCEGKSREELQAMCDFLNTKVAEMTDSSEETSVEE